MYQIFWRQDIASVWTLNVFPFHCKYKMQRSSIPETICTYKHYYSTILIHHGFAFDVYYQMVRLLGIIVLLHLQFTIQWDTLNIFFSQIHLTSLTIGTKTNTIRKPGNKTKWVRKKKLSRVTTSSHRDIKQARAFILGMKMIRTKAATKIC